ncbi:glycosyl hydrolase [Mucilaginibacter sp.]
MKKYFITFLCCLNLFVLNTYAQSKPDAIKQIFLHPPESAKPWIYWYWMQDAVSKEAITADLQSMRDEGIGGAYLMPIKGPANPPFIDPPVIQLSKEWWAMVKFAMSEANRIGVKLAFHDCDGFAVAGGPWITPELSMQKVVWSKILVSGGKLFNDTLAVPKHYKDYYRDIKILAYPSPEGSGISTQNIVPKVTSSTGADVQFLAFLGNKTNFASSEPCWIQLAFVQPFTCRSLVIHTNASNYESERLLVEVSNDGINFQTLTRLEPPRHGWQDGDAQITNDIPEATAKYFRFVYDKAGSEPGSEDLDFAKWKPSLKLSGIELSSEAKIHQYEGKNGEVWRVSKRTTIGQLPQDQCIPKDKIIDITSNLDTDGKLRWNVPPGNWTILRIGHTSTGHTNATGGAGMGLECDKFNPVAVKLQFDNWFGEAVKQAGPDLAKQVLKIFHVDSWEAGSQNWSPVFAGEFKKRRGYDIEPYLPVMAGVPVQSAEVSEKVLSDVRETIAELLVDNFFGTMAKLAHAQGCEFSAESVAPTMVSDGMLHYKDVDLPMGEFWLRSPTHDKPNDILDAISGGHIYGKNIIQAEAFTELRLMWDEHPAMLKAIADREFALGINRFTFHVDVHNPWLNRKPGMTLDGIGTFFQRDQTWWKQGRGWVQYIQRCEAMLQMGRPVTDIAVFTGEETPRRAILTDRLVSTLPGIFGDKRVKQEAERLANMGEPMRIIPDGVSSSANMAEPQQWINPMRGYAYDSFNLDALLRLATVHEGRIELPGGASYAVLVIPRSRPMSPDSSLMSPQAIKKIQQLVKDGATIIMSDKPAHAPGMEDDAVVKEVYNQLLNESNHKGRLITGIYKDDSFDKLGITRDVIITDSTGGFAHNIAWNHRTGKGFDSYFISNQDNGQRTITISLRVNGKLPELFNPLTGETKVAGDWKMINSRTILTIKLDTSGSVFIVLRKPVTSSIANQYKNWPAIVPVKTLGQNWSVQFDKAFGGPEKSVQFTTLANWIKNVNDAIKYYSGTAVYGQTFNWIREKSNNDLWLDVGKVYNLADVYVNGVFCGTAWTYPYRVNIGKALKTGKNEIRIEVSNTWANRLIGDHALPENKRITWTNAVYRLDDKPLLPAGLIGPVKIVQLKY